MFQPFRELPPEKKPLIYAIIGGIVGLILVLLGFWRALFVVLFAAAGYFLGSVPNKGEAIRNLINKWFPPKNQ